MDKFEQFCIKNLIAIVGALLVLGGVIYSVKAQADNLKAQDAKIVDLFKYRTDQKVESAITIVKLDKITSDLVEIKTDLKDIKQNLYKQLNGHTDAKVTMYDAIEYYPPLQATE